ncbi:MAG TPA: Gfo/Idh/MocA family oxidoreductase [Myxococcota bacterium]|nr:Gfo/Idh/MocA family oxidoreductase [Myxococcota bacterium]
MAVVEAVLVGAGNRGRFTYGGFAREHPDRLRLVALAEPDDERRATVAAEHGLGPERVFRDFRELLARPALAPVAIIATGDTLHVAPALAALERGYHVLLEKPIAPEAGDCVRVVEAAERAGRMLQIGHVLRYAPFYTRVHALLSSGRIGRVLTVDMKENVAFWHLTHSYVRGKFRNRTLAAPIVLAKTCHDLDLLCWFVGAPAARVSSFGRLSHFRSEDAPKGAPARCTDGCPVQEGCPHDAVRFYVGPDERIARAWPWTDVSSDPSREARRRALERGPYGACVYRCDNDVPDHQVLAIEFEGGATATFTMNGLGSHEKRTIRVTGTEGELRGVFQDGLLELSRHGSLGVERFEHRGSPFDHFGGDPGLLAHFTDVVARGRPDEVRASGRVSLESHLLGFAAEASRESGRTIEMATHRQEARAAAGLAG